MNETLVACFSPTGTTLKVAQTIAHLVSGDLFQIIPTVPYSSADLNWNNPASRSSVEMKDSACRPPIADMVKDWDNYKTVFLGFPIWWYDAPRIILTFLDSYDFAGKKVYPFATSGGSGLGNIPQNLKNACPSANWQPGVCYAGHADNAAIEKWIRSLG